MAFATLNQYELSVVNGTEETALIGDADRAISGTAIRTTRTHKRTWALTLPLLAPSLADSLRHLVAGDGDVWHFDETSGTDWQWSVKGLGKASGSATSLPGGKFNAGIRIAAAGTVTFTANTGSVWTLMVWYYTGGAFVHYIVRSDGAKWVDGVRNDGASTPFLGNTGTTVVLGDSGSGANQDFDDLVVLPYLLHADLAEAFGAATAAFSDLPKLNLAGGIANSVTTEVMLMSETSVGYTQGWPDGTWAIGRVLSFELEEV